MQTTFESFFHANVFRNLNIFASWTMVNGLTLNDEVFCWRGKWMFNEFNNNQKKKKE